MTGKASRLLSSFLLNILSVALVLLALTVNVSAQYIAPSKHYIHLKSGSILTTQNIDKWFENKVEVGSQQVLIQFDEKLTAIAVERLKNELELIEYIPDNTYKAIIKSIDCKNILTEYGARYIIDVKSEWKLGQSLNDIRSNYKSGDVELLISVPSTISKTKLINYVRLIGGIVLDSKLEILHKYKVRLNTDNILKLAEWYGVSYVDLYPDNKSLNRDARSTTKANIAGLLPQYGGYGLSGEGVTIGIGDNTSGNFHIDLIDRTINYSSQGYADHGVHISGIVGGAGIIDPKGEGPANNSTILSHFYSSVWEQTPEMRQVHNMTLTNNSYAAAIGNCNYAGTYDGISQSLDQMSLLYKDVLHIFASGNDGYLDCTPYPKGFGTVTGGYQPAKNNIVVTSIDKNYVNATDGSRGPIKDGRLKPEITAVGVNVFSTTKSEEYLVAGGTSMATPGVTGCVALLSERFQQVNGQTNPRADVLKALILNGTTDIGNPGPDYRFGFGVMNLAHSLRMVDSNWLQTGTVNNGSAQSYNINVPANIGKLKVMLVWHDLPASAMASKQLVNDLDVVVKTPSGITHKPLILDPSPANILNNAVEGEDHLNNTEQITINNPQAGTYTIIVSGYSISQGNQDYVITYDKVPNGISLTYPTTATQVKTEDSLRVYWDAVTDNGVFKLEYTADNGSNWVIINDNIPADRRYYNWYVPNTINSGKCLMRLSRNTSNDQFTTGLFAINEQPEVKLSSNQCPGYVQVEWSAIPNATAYQILRKVGPHLQAVDTISGTQYTFKGLPINEKQYVAICPIIDGLLGYRSLAISRTPNTGNCNGTISDGDIMIESIVSPNNGRLFTSSALTNATPITIRYRNLDDGDITSYRVSYKLDNNNWSSQIINSTATALSSKDIVIGSEDLSGLGLHTIIVAIENLMQADPVKSNDTLVYHFQQVKNDPININAVKYIEPFESISTLSTANDTFGLTDDRRWDYNHIGIAPRFRSYVNDQISISGNRSISLDASVTGVGSLNEFIGTLNLSNYDVATDEIRLEFKYKVHGIPRDRDSNYVLIRGNDNDNWQRFYTYNFDRNSIGDIQSSGSLSITDILQDTGQAFSSSTQIEFLQYDSSAIALNYYGCGITFDDVEIYTVNNDLQLLDILTPDPTACGITGPSPITISIRNGVSNTLNNIELYYQLDNQSVVKETLASINGKTIVNYTFSQKIDISTQGDHVLNVWVVADGDTYPLNDSILSYDVRSQPLISVFPYLESFEEGQGGWYSNGKNNSWQYGTPAADMISGAYSGDKAWVTNLTGKYNNEEYSYLYSPCFNVGKLENPAFRCRLALDIENCDNVICDEAHMEYTTDGFNWQVLGNPKDGTNWYNDTNNYIWSIENKTMWHEASNLLPKTSQDIQLRFVFRSDMGLTKEGIAVDDVEVYDLRLFTSENDLLHLHPNPTSDGRFQIEWTSTQGTDVNIVMTDVWGRAVYQTMLSSVEGYNQKTVQTPLFAPGMYFLRFQIGDREYSRKIIYR